LKSLGSWDQALALVTAQAGRFITTHPRSTTAAVVLGLAGFGVTAFGIAPMASDPSGRPQRLVTENVNPENVQAQLDALAEHELELYRTDLTRGSDTADSLLARLNVSDAAAADFLRTDPLARRLLDGRGGKMLQVKTDAHGGLTELVARFAVTGAQAATHFNRMRISRADTGFKAQIEVAPMAALVHGQRHGALLALRCHRRRAHLGRCRHSIGGRVFDRHRFPPRSAEGRYVFGAL
jgi:hypothetical protein